MPEATLFLTALGALWIFFNSFLDPSCSLPSLIISNPCLTVSPALLIPLVIPRTPAWLVTAVKPATRPTV